MKFFKKLILISLFLMLAGSVDSAIVTVHYIGVGGAPTSSITHINPVIENGKLTDTETITAVDTTKTLLHVVSWNSGNDSASGNILVELTNSTTITMTRENSSSDATFSMYLITFSDSAINSIQYGQIAITSGNQTNTGTITSVDTSKTVLFSMGSKGSVTENEINTRLDLTNATTVTATRSGTSGTTTVGFCAVEFK